MEAADGRTTRWQDYRVQRRRALVESTLRAVRAHGPLVGMDEIAAVAGTSKAVLYRHFTDRAGLYLAVADFVSEYICLRLAPRLERGGEIVELISETIDSYLELVELDENIYRFMLNRPHLPSTQDPVTGVSEHIGAEIALAIARDCQERNIASYMAVTWGNAIAGAVLAVTNVWLTTVDRPPRHTVVAQVTALFRPAFAAAGCGSKSDELSHQTPRNQGA